MCAFYPTKHSLSPDSIIYMTRTIIDHALEIQETVSLPPGTPFATHTPPHHLSPDTPKGVLKQLEKGKSSTAVTENERTYSWFS